MDIMVGVESDIGIARDFNQDAMCIHSASTDIGDVIIASVCDGMGGMQEGEYASQSLVSRLELWFRNELPVLISNDCSIQECGHSIAKLMEEHNDYLIEYGDSKGISVGTTASVLVVMAERYYIVHVGDSRIYRLDSEGIEQLTEDHSKVMQEVRMGILTEKQARKDPRRNRLTQCVGVKGKITPYIKEGMLDDCQTYLLCSDGFVHEITDRYIWKHLRPDKCDSGSKIKKKVHYLIEKNKKEKETDNITALTLRIKK